MSRSKVYVPTDEEFIKIVKESNSYSDCLRKLGLTTRGGSSSDILKKRINELNLSVDHFGKLTKQSPTARYNLEEILVENSSYHGSARLSIRLVNGG